ncbi:M23 family metallopeptidase [Microbacterium sp. 179-I 3D4 NHS]|uniref:M23 family metallopeptidase n=1 Tax=Microbacterium sp. 179-I 3D4 NHS TaxID=3142381 RepID=UPI0039A2C5DB
MPSRRRTLCALLLVLLCCSVAAPPGLAAATTVSAGAGSMEGLPRRPASERQDGWRWPLDGPRTVVEPFRAPAHAYGAGHRGIDLAASSGRPVRAPAAGVVAFCGVVVDRPVLTIEHAGGLVSTFEPVESPLRAGDPVAAGEEIGTVASGGHATIGHLHLGVRVDGEYINPLLLFGAVERAILLPCCGAR